MRNPWPRLRDIPFPALQRRQLTTLQVNLGYRCNLACLHCHVNAGPTRKEEMNREHIDLVIEFLRRQQIATLDLTGGSPEMNPHFRDLVVQARALGVHVMDRLNPTIVEEPGYGDLPEFFVQHRVELVASLPCYLEDNVDAQRGDGVFASSLRVLQRLNTLGYGVEGSGLVLNLVYNPLGPSLPPPQQALEADYRRVLGERFGLQFNQLYTIANMPIKRFGSVLLSRGQFDDYMTLLRGAHRDENLQQVMCLDLISVDWQGHVHDCDFNQMLGLALGQAQAPVHLRDLLDRNLHGSKVRVAGHCYGCTAGQGSSCGGALTTATDATAPAGVKAVAA